MRDNASMGMSIINPAWDLPLEDPLCQCSCRIKSHTHTGPVPLHKHTHKYRHSHVCTCIFAYQSATYLSIYLPLYLHDSIHLYF